MTELVGTIFPRPEVKTYECLDGDWEYSLFTKLNGEKEEGGNFTEEIKQMNFLVFEGADLKLAPEKEIATHINQYSPEISSPLPREDAAEGDYPKRYVGGWAIRPGEFPLPLISGNAEIKEGDKLNIADSSEGLDKTANKTNVVTALEDVPADTGGTIFVHIEEHGIAVATAP